MTKRQRGTAEAAAAAVKAAAVKTEEERARREYLERLPKGTMVGASGFQCGTLCGEARAAGIPTGKIAEDTAKPAKLIKRILAHESKQRLRAAERAALTKRHELTRESLYNFIRKPTEDAMRDKAVTAFVRAYHHACYVSHSHSRLLSVALQSRLIYLISADNQLTLAHLTIISSGLLSATHISPWLLS